MPPLAQVGAPVVDVVVLPVVVVDVVGGSVTVVVVVLVVVVGARVVVGGGAVVVVVVVAEAQASMTRLSMKISLRFVMSSTRRSMVVAVLLISNTCDLNVVSACRSFTGTLPKSNPNPPSPVPKGVPSINTLPSDPQLSNCSFSSNEIVVMRVG